MTIGINGNEANVKTRVGVWQYAFELLREFSKFQTPNTKFQIYLESPPLSGMPELSYEVFGPGKLWTLTGLQKKILQNPPDVLFTPTHYTPLYVPCPSVISIMDLAFEKFPQYFKPGDLYQLKYWTRYSARQAKKILTISNSSKKDICELYRIPEEKVVVTYPGYDVDRFNERTKVSRSLTFGTQKYLLFVGTLQPRKNLLRLIEAFALLKDKDIMLLIAGLIREGRGGWMNQGVFKKVEQLGLGNRVKFTGYVSNEEIPGLMKGAKAFVLPSLYEGFGIPAIEAMAVGTPVIVSQVSSLPEICGDAAFYIDDPYNVDSIRIALETVDKSKTKLGLELVKRYNWKTTAEQTLEVLKNV